MSAPLRIGLIMQGGAGWMGGAEYIKNLAQALALAGPEHCVSIISGAPLDDSQRIGLPAGTDIVTLPPRRHGRLERWLHSGRSALAAAVRCSRFDFIYPFTYDNEHNLGVSFPLGSALAPTRWAGWIPDFQHRHLPEFFNSAEIARRDKGIAALAEEAESIVFSSAASSADFTRFCPGARARTELLRFCSAPDPAWYSGDPAGTQATYHLPERFLLISNQFWQHKNHLLVFEALALLAARGIHPHMVCTGHPADFRDKNYFSVVLQRLHRSGIAAQVSLLGLIPRADQVQLMRRSLAVLQPSLSEGWSTVVEDARLLGKPVILSDLDVHREQNPPGACFFDRTSAESLANALAGAWCSGTPGPDLLHEQTAQTAAHLAQLAFGRRFLEIAGASREAAP